MNKIRELWLGAKILIPKIILAITSITAIFGLLDYFFKWKIFNFIGVVLRSFLDHFATEFNKLPYLYIIVSIAILSIYLFWKKLSIVAGDFKDNFDRGLDKWEYGGEGWKIEYEKGRPLLSVSESQDGGITKKGFIWSDYEFSFETKIIKHNAGWIIRAENRNKYLMIQLHMEDESRPKLRLHLRYPQFPWVVTEEKNINLNKPIKYLEWMKIKIIVFGSNVDVYINNEHCAHYFLPDPFRFKINEESKEVVMNYAVGKVGFRCAPPNEHAHFRRVLVRPIL